MIFRFCGKALTEMIQTAHTPPEYQSKQKAGQKIQASHSVFTVRQAPFFTCSDKNEWNTYMWLWWLQWRNVISGGRFWKAIRPLLWIILNSVFSKKIQRRENWSMTYSTNLIIVPQIVHQVPDMVNSYKTTYKRKCFPIPCCVRCLC
jgi:hypothetical protein